MPHIIEHASGHVDEIRHTDLDAGLRALHELVDECRRSREVIEHAKLDLKATPWANR